MALNFRRIRTGIQIIPKSVSSVDTAGELDFDTSSNKLNLHNGTISSPVVTESSTATLTNKTISVSSNTISSTTNRVPQFNVSTGALEPSSVTNTELSYVSGVTSSIQTQLNAISAGGANTALSNLSSTSLNASIVPNLDNSIELGSSSKRFKTVYTELINITGVTVLDVVNRQLLNSGGVSAIDFSSPTNLILKNITVANDSITSSTAADLTIATQNNKNMVLSPNGLGIITASKRIRSMSTIQYDLLSDSTPTGTSAFLSDISHGFLRLTNGSLVSVGGIVIGLEGQYIIVSNVTGNSITINNEDSGQTAGNRILTGTGSNLTLPNTGSLSLIYDTVTNRWRVIGV